jgi:hypothetical protein
MKHAREEYNTRIVDLDNKILEDEPVFLLRGQDKCFVPMLQLYLFMVSITTGDVEVIKSLYSHIAYGEAWQTVNKDRVKFADLPIPENGNQEALPFWDDELPRTENPKGVDAGFTDGEGLASGSACDLHE